LVGYIKHANNDMSSLFFIFFQRAPHINY